MRYIVTKLKYKDKPNYRDLHQSLVGLAERLVELEVQNISVPQLGSGCDKLNWEKVEALIGQVFSKIPTRVTVYYLKPTFIEAPEAGNAGIRGGHVQYGKLMQKK